MAAKPPEDHAHRLETSRLSSLLAACCLTVTASTAGAASFEKDQSCSLTVRFASYAMGIDRGAALSIERMLRDDPSVRKLEKRPWGREGEYDLCAQVASPADSQRLLALARGLIPVRPRGPVFVEIAGRRHNASGR